MKGFKITQRKIQVLKMDDTSINALDIDKGQLRIFKLENILSAIDTRLIENNQAIKGNYHDSGQAKSNFKIDISIYTR